MARRARPQERAGRRRTRTVRFLTTEANAIVAPIHPQAMPVILTSPADVDLWFAADAADALMLQRPLPDDALRIVAKGEKEDGPAV
jgi:putative SOS response-associated peptidase YedK